MQKLLLQEHRKKMQANWNMPDSITKNNLEPVVKLFHAYGRGTWLFTEWDEESDQLFGLCDLGMGFPELGYACLGEMQHMQNRFGWQMIERDTSWSANMTLGEYADKARREQGISA